MAGWERSVGFKMIRAAAMLLFLKMVYSKNLKQELVFQRCVVFGLNRFS